MSHSKRFFYWVLGGVACVMLISLASCASGSELTEPASGSVSIRVIGPDAQDADSLYAEQSVSLSGVEGAWEATQQVFDAAGLSYDAANSDYGIMLNSITNPATGDVLAFDETTGNYWQLFVDGTASEVGIDGVELSDDQEIAWYYSAFGAELPQGELPVVEVLDNAA